jgi:hypothetical protein
MSGGSGDGKQGWGLTSNPILSLPDQRGFAAGHLANLLKFPHEDN